LAAHAVAVFIPETPVNGVQNVLAVAVQPPNFTHLPEMRL